MSAEQDELQLWDEAHMRHEHLLTRLGGIPELPMRMAILRDMLTATAPRETVWHLARLLRGALSGRNPHIDAVHACAFWLIEEQAQQNSELFQDLFMAAHTEDRPEVMNLLRDPLPHMQLPPESRLPEVRLPLERDITLGERRSMARSSNRKLLERLLMDPSELVLDRLLDNPSVQHHDVLLIASRRPTKPELLLTVARRTPWLQQRIIREALVRNPYVHTGIALKLLPTLNIREIRQIALAGDLHPLVAQFAQLLVQLRATLLGPER